VDGRQVISGNALFLAEHGLEADGLNNPAAELAATGKTPTFIAIDGTITGIIAVADTVKPGDRALIPAAQEGRHRDGDDHRG
jgi:cation transport ATPase